MRVTLDRAVTDTGAVMALVRERLAVEPISLSVDDVDFVRETTRVSVRYAVDDGWWSWSDAQSASDRADEAENEASGAR